MDLARFRELYQRVAPNLLAYLRYWCRDLDLADDLLQETFLRVLQASPTGLDASQMKAYLYKTAKTAMSDSWRKRQREMRWNIEGASNVEESAVQDGEISQDMLRLLNQLTERARTILWLAYVEGFSHREIADILGVKASGVRVMLMRARKQLAEKLAHEGIKPEES